MRRWVGGWVRQNTLTLWRLHIFLRFNEWYTHKTFGPRDIRMTKNAKDGKFWRRDVLKHTHFPLSYISVGLSWPQVQLTNDFPTTHVLPMDHFMISPHLKAQTTRICQKEEILCRKASLRWRWWHNSNPWQDGSDRFGKGPRMISSLAVDRPGS